MVSSSAMYHLTVADVYPEGALNAESALPDISGLSIADPAPCHRHHFPASPPTTPTRDNRHRRRPPTPHTVVNITVNATTAPVTVHTGDSGNSPSGNTRRRGILVERSPSPSARTASSRTSLADSSIPADRPSYLHPSVYVETTSTPPQSPRRSRTGYVLDEEVKAHRLAVIEETLREVRAEREEEMRRSQYALPAAHASPSKPGPQPSDEGIRAEREEQMRRPQRAAAPPAARTSARKPDPQPSDEGIRPEGKSFITSISEEEC